jgi:hypothetical protein
MGTLLKLGWASSRSNACRVAIAAYVLLVTVTAKSDHEFYTQAAPCPDLRITLPSGAMPEPASCMLDEVAPAAATSARGTSGKDSCQPSPSGTGLPGYLCQSLCDVLVTPGDADLALAPTRDLALGRSLAFPESPPHLFLRPPIYSVPVVA